MCQLKIEATKFTLVGILNFFLTFIIFTVMLKGLAIDYLVSLGTAWAVGVVFSYQLNFVWVFKSEQSFRFGSRFAKFVLANLSSIILNMLSLKYLADTTQFEPYYIQFALIPFVVIYNFATAKFWSLKPAV